MEKGKASPRMCWGRGIVMGGGRWAGCWGGGWGGWGSWECWARWGGGGGSGVGGSSHHTNKILSLINVGFFVFSGFLGPWVPGSPLGLWVSCFPGSLCSWVPGSPLGPWAPCFPGSFFLGSLGSWVPRANWELQERSKWLLALARRRNGVRNGC